MRRRCATVGVLAVMCAASAPALANAAITESAAGIGRMVQPPGTNPQSQFSSFAFAVAEESVGTTQGIATFGGVGGDPRAFVTVRVDCIRTTIDTFQDADGSVVNQLVAIMTGHVVRATDGSYLGSLTIFHAIDGDQTTRGPRPGSAAPAPDRIDAAFRQDLPPGVTCDNVGLGIVNPPIAAGEIVVQHP